MTTRIIIAAVAASMVAPSTFGQMKYSRPRSQQSPTPTPTPLQVIPPKEAAVRSQPQRTTPTPTPSRQTFGPPQSAMQKPTPVPTPAKQAYLQLQKPTQKTAATLPSPQQTFRQAQVPPQTMTPAPIPAKPTPTPVPPPDVKAYLDRQIANSKDKKFHMTVNGKDLALTPFHVWSQKGTGADSTSTCIDMRSDEGRIYDIDFVTTGAQVSGIRIHKVNGETVR